MQFLYPFCFLPLGDFILEKSDIRRVGCFFFLSAEFSVFSQAQVLSHVFPVLTSQLSSLTITLQCMLGSSPK